MLEERKERANVVDQLTRVMHLITVLQESIVRWREYEGTHASITEWLDLSQADVRELCELKGNDTVESFLGLGPGTITRWRRDRDFTDPPEVVRERELARQKQREAALLRLKEDSASLRGMQPARWLDRHRQDVELLLTLGLTLPALADLFDINPTTMLGWAKRREIPQPLAKEGDVVEVQPPERTEEKLPDLASWRELGAKELQKLVATDVNTLGKERAYEVWKARGLSAGMWNITIHWARKRGLITVAAVPKEERPESGTQPRRAPSCGEESYWKAKYEGMKEALEIIFGGRRQA